MYKSISEINKPMTNPIFRIDGEYLYVHSANIHDWIALSLIKRVRVYQNSERIWCINLGPGMDYTTFKFDSEQSAINAVKILTSVSCLLQGD